MSVASRSARRLQHRREAAQARLELGQRRPEAEAHVVQDDDAECLQSRACELLDHVEDLPGCRP